MAESSIEWTDETWNPTTGCTRAGPECDNCYAVPMSDRLAAMGQADYVGLTVRNGKGDRHFNGVVRTRTHKLADPFSWRKGRRVFVNSMSDLFHRDVPFEFIDKVFAVMAMTPQHTYQILTKRPERMAEYAARIIKDAEDEGDLLWNALDEFEDRWPDWSVWSVRRGRGGLPFALPLPNVWMGTSVGVPEALGRIDDLRNVTAAIRFLSLEPMIADLGAINFDGIDWAIVGGESGHGARQFNVEWARSIIAQCKVAGVACFVKQLGAKPVEPVTECDDCGGDGEEKIPCDDDDTECEFCRGAGTLGGPLMLKDKKGGDPSEWPEDLRVREWPATKASTP